MFQYTAQSEADTMRLAEVVAAELRGGDVLALVGPLGSGKTRFVKGLVRGLKLMDETVSSPTYLICHEYRPATPPGDGPSLSLAHIDAYRLSSEDDLESIGWDELLAQDDLVLAVEWADRIENALPEHCVRIEFEHAGERARRITVSDRTGEPRFADLGQAMSNPSAQRCPICTRIVDEDASTSPFCSNRCRMADLGAWMSGGRMISRPIEQHDLEEGV